MNRYKLVHRELRLRRGSAVRQPCVAPDCTRLADGWGLVGDATHYGYDGRVRVRWSTRLNDYAPLCTRHNNQLDRGGDWVYCPRGHVRAAWGTTRKGDCRGCDRERSRERRARARAAASSDTNALHAHSAQ